MLTLKEKRLENHGIPLARVPRQCHYFTGPLNFWKEMGRKFKTGYDSLEKEGTFR